MLCRLPLVVATSICINSVFAIAITALWGNDLNGLCGIDGKSRGKQEDGQETANALESAWSAPPVAGAHAGIE
jgi:hypothetical protein